MYFLDQEIYANIGGFLRSCRVKMFLTLYPPYCSTVQ